MWFFFFSGVFSLLSFVILISYKYSALPISESLPPRISVAKGFKVYIITFFFLLLLYLAKFIVSGVPFWRERPSLFRENFAMDGLRVTGTDRKEMKLGLTEDKFCFFLDGVWEWFVFKAGISSRSITHRGIQGHFLSEVVFSWDVDPFMSQHL